MNRTSLEYNYEEQRQTNSDQVASKSQRLDQEDACEACDCDGCWLVQS